MGINYQAQMLGGIAPPSMDPASFVHPAILRGLEGPGLMDDFASNQYTIIIKHPHFNA